MKKTILVLLCFSTFYLTYFSAAYSQDTTSLKTADKLFKLSLDEFLMSLSHPQKRRNR